MTAMTHNHVNYEKRLALVRSLFHQRFKLEDPVTVVPIAYKEDVPFKSNNFIYKVIIPSGQTIRIGSKQPGCTTVPGGGDTFVLRLSNRDASGMNTFNRIENEVAAMALFSEALSHIKPSIVPSVYAWESATVPDSQGWILQEFLPGIPLDEVFDNMAIDQKRSVFSQLARVLDGMQKFRLPKGVTQFGGLTFDSEGAILSSRMTVHDAGPWLSYEAYFKERMKRELSQVDDNPYIRGWRQNGVRERLEAFVENGLPDQFLFLTEEEDKVIVHGDLTANNLQYDPETERITALLDYDWACVSHPCHEFLESFDGTGGDFRGWTGDEKDQEIELRHAKLYGFPLHLPASTEEVDWEIAKAWEDELSKLQVRRPRTIPGIQKIADVMAVSKAIVPWRLTNEDVLQLQSEEAKIEQREQCEQRLVKMLDRLSY